MTGLLVAGSMVYVPSPASSSYTHRSVTQQDLNFKPAHCRLRAKMIREALSLAMVGVFVTDEVLVTLRVTIGESGAMQPQTC